jgi:ribosomal protein S20
MRKPSSARPKRRARKHPMALRQNKNKRFLKSRAKTYVRVVRASAFYAERRQAFENFHAIGSAIADADSKNRLLL